MISHVGDKRLRLYRKFPRIIKLYDEYFDWLEEPHRFVEELKNKEVAADIFTFVQKGVAAETPKYHFYHEYDAIAVLHITSYDEWLKKQIKHEERNRIKKALKSQVEVRPVVLDDEFVLGIKRIYDEAPIRQGKDFRHYNKSLEDVKKEVGTFPETSRFIGAFHRDELIGFVKFIQDGDVAYLMQAISMIAHRDKSPTNALMAKAVEYCEEHGIHYMRYGNWSRRGLGHFKRSHGFVKVEVPRYFIPLNSTGKLAMSLKLHREVADLVPEKLMDLALGLRSICKGKLFHANESQRSN